MNQTDIFLCYRRPGAQTAKLFKRYLLRRNLPADVWYLRIPASQQQK